MAFKRKQNFESPLGFFVDATQGKRTVDGTQQTSFIFVKVL